MNPMRKETFSSKSSTNQIVSPSQKQLGKSQSTIQVEELAKSTLDCQQADYPSSLHQKTQSTPLEELKKEVQVFQQILLGNFDHEGELPNFLSAREGIKAHEQCIASLMLKAKEELAINPKEQSDYGTKCANLLQQGRLIDQLEIQGVKMPPRLGIESDSVLAFLQKKKPEIFHEWQKLGELFEKHAGELPFLQTLEAKRSLSIIDEGIKAAFAQLEEESSESSDLLSQQLIVWLKEQKQAGTYLMVRSSGAEDSKETANAGGNVSKAYVLPEQKPFLQAMSEVVRSYFSETSLGNRIEANLNPFKEELKLSVMSETVIGEDVEVHSTADEIPISLVLFSCEPLYVGNELFRVMRISATYGHGEGVVGNKRIPCDTVLILISETNPSQLYVLYDNQEKPYRLAPVDTADGIELKKVANPEELRKKAALTPELLARLYHWGVVGEKFFGDRHSDMEIVVKNNILYPVQARDINRKPMLPTFIDMKKVAELIYSPIENSLQAEMLVPGKASVIVVQSPDEIVMADSLDDATRAFNKKMHKIIITRYPEPANSHFVVVNSERRIPCLVVQDAESFNALLSEMSANRPLVICMQSSKLYLWNTQKSDVQAAVSKGFAFHPAKVNISLSDGHDVLQGKELPTEVPPEIQELLSTIRAATTQEVALAALKQLKKHEWVVDIKEKKNTLQRAFLKQSSLPENLSKAYQVVDALDKKIMAAFGELKNAWRNKGENERLRPLLHAKVLETLLVSSPVAGGTLCRYSLIDVKSIYNAAIAMVEYQEGLSHPAHLADLLHLGAHAYTPETTTHWISFLKELEALIENHQISRDQLHQFKALMSMLNEAELMPLWLSAQFSQMASKSPGEKFVLILRKFPKEEREAINHWQTKLQNLEHLKNELENFSDLTTYEDARHELRQALSPFYPGEQGTFSLQNELQAKTLLRRSIALKAMSAAVQLFDSSIKTMKKASNWPIDVKVVKFKEMLDTYLALLEVWIGTVIDSKAIPCHISSPVSAHLITLRSTLNRSQGDMHSQLLPSRNFSVAAATLGAQTAFIRHLPRTLEDLFTLIHQDLLFVIAQLNHLLYTDELLQKIALPIALKEALATINTENLNCKVRNCKVSQIGIAIENESIRFDYNVPLRNHSGQFSFVYDSTTCTSKLKCSLLGPARERWGFNKILLELLDQSGVLPLSGPIKIGEQELSFTWETRSKEKLLMALREYGAMAESTIEDSQDSQTINLVKRAIQCYSRGNQEKLIHLFKKFFLSKSNGEHLISTYIWEGLLKQKLAAKDLLEMTAIAIAQGDQRNCLSSLKLLTGLSEKGKRLSDGDWETLANTALQLLSNQDSEVRESVLYLLWNIASKEKGSKSVEMGALVALQDELASLRTESLELFMLLVQCGQGLDSAKAAVKQSLQDSDEGVRNKARELQDLLEI